MAKQVRTVRKVVDLNDPEYFCNKSWTISYNFNTRSWISYHTYLPNWYIGANNFFYSGLNGCCDEFDFIAGTLIPTPSTTTTTTIAPSTTTTTTTVFTGCDLEGNIIRTYCDIIGTGIITTPPVCKRPLGLIPYDFITGYKQLPSGPTIISTGSSSDACSAVSYINSQPDDVDPTYEMTFISVFVKEFVTGVPVYLDNGTDDCSLLADGWYFLEEQLDQSIIFLVSSGVIVSMQSCVPTTTTTTTAGPALPCNTYTASKSTAGVVNFTYKDCNGADVTDTIGNSGGGMSTKVFCASSITGFSGDVTIIYNGPC